jgi:hypothetical protein
MARRKAESPALPASEPAFRERAEKAYAEIGIDFAEMARRSYEKATPEERARIDAHREARARTEGTRASIPALFERLGMRPPRTRGGIGERFVQKTWTRDVGIQIEGEPGSETVRFTEAVTGHEAFRIDEEFCRLLEDPDENRQRPRFYICAGTPNSYDACSVDPADVAAYLRERRPEMFEASAGMAP